MPVRTSDPDRSASPSPEHRASTTGTTGRRRGHQAETPTVVRRRGAGTTWAALIAGALLLALLVVFLLQNTAPVEVVLFGLSGTAPLALALLVAAVGTGFLALAVGTLRGSRLRNRLGQDRRTGASGGREI